MKRQLRRVTPLNVVLAASTAVAAFSTFGPWEHNGFSSTDGVWTFAGLWVLFLVIIIGAFVALRIVEDDLPHAFEVPILAIASVALVLMLAFYVTQIGRVDSGIADSTRPVEVRNAFFVTLGALIVIEVTVAAHYFSSNRSRNGNGGATC